MIANGLGVQTAVAGSARQQAAATGRRILGAVVAGLLSAAPTARAEPLAAAYEITWNGMAVGSFATELVTGPERYRFTYEARTTGWLGWLFPFTSEGWSEGELRDRRPRPERYEVQSRWHDGGSDYGVRFGPDGRALQMDVSAEERADREPVPAPLQVGPDPLALALEAFARVAPGAALSGASFDGKRALGFEVACADDLVVPDPVRAGAARAATPPVGGEPLVACQIDGRLLAGASRRWRSRDADDTDRQPVTVWLSQGVLVDRFWPVRVETETRFGAVSADLVALEPPTTRDEATRP